ncbi:MULTISPECIES: ABC transporter permease [Aminobacterium]|jgi:ribose/xylose/arabinose/galactoside ABC-type transport system permease subunit|uniref:ABC transporter permease n=1 Tax=Aminobacterium TaxID=81466 RepID=UPI00046781DE|nr:MULTISPECIES: ABC transporter permease [Aminobacterium]
MWKRDPLLRNLLLLLIVLVSGFSLVLHGQFFSMANLQSMAFQLPELGILAIAMMITMVSGGINLSIIATANVAGISAAYILTSMLHEGISASGMVFVILLAFSAALFVSFIVGAINGFVVSYIGVSAILATLGTMTVVEGLSVLITKGSVISGFPAPILFIGNGTIAGIPVPLFIFAFCAIVVSIFLEKTPFGVGVYMIGSNIKATDFSGIEVKKVLVKVYILSGILCGIAALIMISRFNSARAGYGSSYLLVTVLASVLGGINPDGGFGKVAGLVIALVVLQVISSGLNLLGMSAHLAIALWGGILIFVISLSVLKDKFSKPQAKA